ncbi:GntR family transcriptional regulator [Mobilicoccus caccae]|uniref:GntR family transcriptional regulator n=1 Tax=Mobilicoccus caccae TaxID=1859295 RepID=A0ABQ6IRC5_9MICO|nr:GntR family transcriptional regulator [Mobilicoccus caccae]GMA40478.1 GntR family transcriptional regulator [Mobilicoccus caccae]
MATTPAAQKIRHALENAIVDGTLSPGDRIDPDALAVTYRCSRTPVREALHALEASGLVRVMPKRGTYVEELSVAQLTERFEVMAEFEALCSRLACRRATAEDVTRIDAALAACDAAAEAGDPDRYYHENTAFHHAIYAAAHNEFLEREALRLQAMLQPYRRRQLRALGRVRQSMGEHHAIAGAIRAGDEDEAMRVMRGHVLIQGDRFRDLVATR